MDIQSQFKEEKYKYHEDVKFYSREQNQHVREKYNFDFESYFRHLTIYLFYMKNHSTTYELKENKFEKINNYVDSELNKNKYKK